MRAVSRDQDVVTFLLNGYWFSIYIRSMARPLALADTCLDKRWRSKSVEVSQHGGVTEAMLLGGGDSAQGQEIPIRKVDAVSDFLW